MQILQLAEARETTIFFVVIICVLSLVEWPRRQTNGLVVVQPPQPVCKGASISMVLVEKRHGFERTGLSYNVNFDACKNRTILETLLTCGLSNGTYI
jgi:hypothetical protein